MSFEPRDYLRHMLEEADFLVAETRELTKQEFLGDKILRRAFVRSIEVIGEAAKQVPPDFRAKHPDAAWRVIAGMRDKLIHHSRPSSRPLSADHHSIHVTTMPDRHPPAVLPPTETKPPNSVGVSRIGKSFSTKGLYVITSDNARPRSGMCRRKEEPVQPFPSQGGADEARHSEHRLRGGDRRRRRVPGNARAGFHGAGVLRRLLRRPLQDVLRRVVLSMQWTGVHPSVSRPRWCGPVGSAPAGKPGRLDEQHSHSPRELR